MIAREALSANPYAVPTLMLSIHGTRCILIGGSRPPGPWGRRQRRE